MEIQRIDRKFAFAYTDADKSVPMAVRRPGLAHQEGECDVPERGIAPAVEEYAP
jgi:hypothetical protein